MDEQRRHRSRAPMTEDDHARVLVDRLRAGEISHRGLELAAWAGHHPARLATGDPSWVDDTDCGCCDLPHPRRYHTDGPELGQRLAGLRGPAAVVAHEALAKLFLAPPGHTIPGISREVRRQYLRALTLARQWAHVIDHPSPPANPTVVRRLWSTYEREMRTTLPWQGLPWWHTMFPWPDTTDQQRDQATRALLTQRAPYLGSDQLVMRALVTWALKAPRLEPWAR